LSTKYFSFFNTQSTINNSKKKKITKCFDKHRAVGTCKVRITVQLIKEIQSLRLNSDLCMHAKSILYF
jgi:hypothetical protein